MSISTALNAAKTAVTSTAGRTVLKASKHSPTLLFAAGTVGFVATTVLAGKATLRLEETTDPFNEKLGDAKAATKNPDFKTYTDKDFKHDAAVLYVQKSTAVVRLYAPTLLVGGATLFCFGKSHLILTRRNAAVMAAYTALDKGFKEYRSRVTEFVGEEKERELRYGSETREVAVDTENGTEVETVTSYDGKNDPSVYARIFGQDTSQSWSPHPETNLFFLRGAQNYANDRLRTKGHLLLNDVYDQLGLTRTKAGCVTGWVWGSKTGANFVDFGIFNGQDMLGFHDFFTGREGHILLDFNVDGIVIDQI